MSKMTKWIDSSAPPRGSIARALLQVGAGEVPGAVRRSHGPLLSVLVMQDGSTLPKGEKTCSSSVGLGKESNQAFSKSPCLGCYSRCCAWEQYAGEEA